jgi:hypothetical protein
MTVRHADPAVIARLRPRCAKCHEAGRVMLDSAFMRWRCASCLLWTQRVTAPERTFLFPRSDALTAPQ